MVSTPDLSSLLPAINEQGYTTEIMPPTDAAPVEQLLVFLNMDYRRRQRYVELVFVPEMEELTILQMFVLMPFEIEHSSISTLSRVLLQVNRLLPITGFGLSEHEGWAYFRYLMICPDGSLDPETTATAVWMIEHLLDRFTGLIEEVAKGGMTLEQGERALQRNLEEWIPSTGV